MAYIQLSDIGITGVVTAVPKNKINNNDLTTEFGEKHIHKFIKTTGVQTRRVAAEHQTAAALDFGALTHSVRSQVKTIQYVCDSKEAYSLCVMEAKNGKGAKKLYNALKKYQKANSKSDYLSDYSKTEQKVFKNAIYGKKGTFVWYIAMSPSKAVNKKGQAALKKKL